MKRFFLTLFFIPVFAWGANAQYNDHRDRKLDSLENVVAGWTPERLANAPFETRADVCLAFSQLMYGYERINPDRSMYAARRAYDLGNELKSLYQPYLASKFIGQLFYNKEQYDSTIFYYRVALGYLDRMAAGEAGPDTPEGYPQEKIDDAASSLYGNIGNLYYEIDSLPQAINYYAKAGDIFKKYDWKISSSILEHNMGDIWAGEGNDAKAIECYNNAIRYAQEAGDSRHQDQEYYDRIATLDIMGQAYQTQKRQRSMLATAFAVLASVLLSLLVISRRALRLKKENAAADEAIGEALTELEKTDSLSQLKMARKVELSRGEKEILPMLAEGLTSKDIAKRLFLTEQTIKWRRQRLLAKFDAKNTAEMLSKAREQGLG